MNPTPSQELIKGLMTAKVVAYKEALKTESKEPAKGVWPKEFVSKELLGRGKPAEYRPHNQDEFEAVYTDSPRRVLIKGGLGSGKSTCGIIKTLNRLRRGCNGALLSTDFPHLPKSLWPAFKN